MTNDPKAVSVNGIWVRSRQGKLQVLVELNDGWHMCANEPPSDNFEWMINPENIPSAPLRYTPEGDRA